MAGQLLCYICKDKHKADSYHFPKFIEQPQRVLETRIDDATGKKVKEYRNKMVRIGVICRKCCMKDERLKAIKEFNIVPSNTGKTVNQMIRENIQFRKQQSIEKRRKELCESQKPSTHLRKPGLIRSIISSLKKKARHSIILLVMLKTLFL